MAARFASTTIRYLEYVKNLKRETDHQKCVSVFWLRSLVVFAEVIMRARDPFRR